MTPGPVVFDAIDSETGRRVGYVRNTAAGRWMALAFSVDDDEWSRLGHHLERDGARRAIEIACSVAEHFERPIRVRLEPRRIGDLAVDAF